MSKEATKLSVNNISSQVFIISPKQISEISENFSEMVANELNMQIFKEKIFNIAQDSILKSLRIAKISGKKNSLQENKSNDRI